jgi:hypothetical protein
VDKGEANQMKNTASRNKNIDHFPSHVIALTLVDGATLGPGGVVMPNSKVLVVVRKESANLQHANVACVPTKRVPSALFWDILGTPQLPPTQVLLELPDSLFFESGLKSGEQSTIYATDAILAGKLGLSEALEKRQIKYKVRPVIAKSGLSPIINSEDLPEPLHMLNLLVVVDQGAELFCNSSSASYGPIQWLAVQEFQDGIKKGVISLIDQDIATALQYKCGGLCSCTSDLLVAASRSSTLY